MSYEYNGQVALLLDIVNKLQYLCLNRNVQRGGGLVTNQYFRIAGKRNSYNYTLAHTAGELERILLKAALRIRDTHGFHKLKRLCAGVVLVHLVVKPQHLRYLVAYFHYGVQCGQRILEYEAYPLAANAVEFILMHLCKVHSVIKNLAGFYYGVVRQYTHNGLDADGLARTGLADYRQRFAPVKVEIYAAHSLHQSAVSAEVDAKVLHAENYFFVHIFITHSFIPLRVLSGQGRP